MRFTLALDLGGVTDTVDALREHGIGFALDDFETGFSSLSYLRRLSLEQLKIDQSFVRQMCSSDEDRAIVGIVVALAQDVHLGLFAEGVETEEHRKVLREMGCDLYQGYLFSRALPLNDF